MSTNFSICPMCGREIALRTDGRPRAHKPRRGALNNCPGGGRNRCQHEHVKTLRSIPPRSKCTDCGALVERAWVTAPTAAGEGERGEG